MTTPADPAERARDAFGDAFGPVRPRMFRAPGRVNLIGEHTDYNDGFVLPCAIDRHTVVAIAPRADRRVEAVACDFGAARVGFALDAPIGRDSTQPWSDYVGGVVREILALCPTLGGFDIAIAGDVPRGAGLSSSASLEVAVATAVDGVFSLGLDGFTRARIGQRAENDFVGCRCGIMDQLVSAVGRGGHASLIDCRTLEVRPVPIPAERAVLIVDSRIERGLVDSAYNARRAQCESAAAALGVRALRDATEEQLESVRSSVDPEVFRRARHVITENARTLEAADALAALDHTRVAALMAASHRSLRDDFEVTVPPIDHLVALVSEICPKAAVRMTGGGFGGCVVAIVPSASADRLAEKIVDAAPGRAGVTPAVWRCVAADGAGEIG